MPATDGASPGLVASLAAIALGAVLGAWGRWGLALALTRAGQPVPLGTLAANLAGGLAIGAAMGWIESRAMAPELRLFLVTGVLGALTTFSTFSAESLGLLQRGEIAGALLHAGLHVLGSLAATGLGWWLVR